MLRDKNLSVICKFEKFFHLSYHIAMNKAEVKKLNIYCNFALLTTAFLLGMSFVAQKAGMEYLGPFTFNTLRFFVGSITLWCVMVIGEKFELFPPEKNDFTALVKGGWATGLALFCAFSINQYCMQFAQAGKAGFITSLYVIFVPLIWLFKGRTLTNNVKIGLLLAVVGLYLLCAKGDFSFDLWDIGILISAFFFGLHIIAVGAFTKKTNAIKLSLVQFLVAGILSAPFMLLFETVNYSAVKACLMPILFIGVVVSGGAYTLQIFGQKAAKPVQTTLIMSLESVFAVLGGFVFLNETLTLREGFGCLFMIIAIIISQLHIKHFQRPQVLTPESDDNVLQELP